MGLSAREIGVVLIFGGFFLVLFQVTVFPRVLARLGVTGGLRIGSVVFSVAVLVAPCASLPGVVESPAARWATLLSSQAVKIATLAVLFTTVIMAVNNSCVNRVKARVNGAATTAAALTRIISPVVHGVIFSRSLRLPSSTPRQFVVFAFVGASSLALRGLPGGSRRGWISRPRRRTRGPVKQRKADGGRDCGVGEAMRRLGVD